MARRRVKLPAWLSLVAVVAVAVLSLASQLSRPVVTVSDGELVVHFIDVGQGDAALLVTSEGTVMIDAGPRSSRDTLLEYVRTHTERIDLMILTHPHEDHIAGAATVLNAIPTATLVMPDVTADTSIFVELLDAIEASEAKVDLGCAGKVYTVGGMQITLLAPTDAEYESMNDYSIVCRVDYGECSFIFTGDAEKASEEKILAAYSADELRCDVLKVGHHGSASSSSKQFLAVLRPSIAVISLAADNSYGHPHSQTLNRLRSAGVNEIYRTDTAGTVVLITDGHKIKLG